MSRNIGSPKDLVDRLVELFPAFAEIWDDGRAFGDDRIYTYHTVFLTFGPESHRLLKAASPKQRKLFCAVIDHFVGAGGEMENAASTCLLEHASQIGIRKLIRPHLSAAARDELR